MSFSPETPTVQNASIFITKIENYKITSLHTFLKKVRLAVVAKITRTMTDPVVLQENCHTLFSSAAPTLTGLTNTDILEVQNINIMLIMQSEIFFKKIPFPC